VHDRHVDLLKQGFMKPPKALRALPERTTKPEPATFADGTLKTCWDELTVAERREVNAWRRYCRRVGRAL
jgi:hypothetical protein